MTPSYSPCWVIRQWPDSSGSKFSKLPGNTALTITGSIPAVRRKPPLPLPMKLEFIYSRNFIISAGTTIILRLLNIISRKGYAFSRPMETILRLWCLPLAMSCAMEEIKELNLSVSFAALIILACTPRPPTTNFANRNWPGQTTTGPPPEQCPAHQVRFEALSLMVICRSATYRFYLLRQNMTIPKQSKTSLCPL